MNDLSPIMIEFSVRRVGYNSEGFLHVWDTKTSIMAPEDSTIQQVLERLLKKENDFDEEDIDNLRMMISTQEWHGGQWNVNESEGVASFATDVVEEQFRIKRT